MSIALAVSLSLGALPSGAAFSRLSSPNPFCQSMIAVHPQPPTASNYVAYRTFAKTYLPYYQKLQRLATNASDRRVLVQLIAIMISERATSSVKALGAIVQRNQIAWATDWTLFAKAIVRCGAWAVNLL